MPGTKRNVLVFAILLTSLLLGIQVTRAGDCADGNMDACWARFYTPDSPMGEEGRVYFRIYRACQDGIRIGIATNFQEDYDFYIKQYGSGEAPPYRLLTEETHVNLNHYPVGTDIEFTDETATSYGGTTTVYYVKVFNVGWSEAFDPDYMDGILIASSDYGYSEDTIAGMVRYGDFEDCHTYNAPFDTLISPDVCVIPERDGSLTAVFSYNNRDRVDSMIPNGPNNMITQLSGAPLKVSTPALFEPGWHNNALRYNTRTPGLIWQIEGARAVATLGSPRCKPGG